MISATVVGPASEPVRITASVQPVTSDELAAAGQDLSPPTG